MKFETASLGGPSWGSLTCASDPRAIMDGPALVLETSARNVEVANGPKTPVPPGERAAITETAARAAPRVGVNPETVRLGGNVYAIGTMFYPRFARWLADELQGASQELDEYYYNEFWGE